MAIKVADGQFECHTPLSIAIGVQRKAIGHAFDPEPMASYLPLMEDILRSALEEWSEKPAGVDLRAAVGTC